MLVRMIPIRANRSTRTSIEWYPPSDLVDEYLCFRLANELFAISIMFIREIIKPTTVTDLPRTEPEILGILSLRGTVVPVVDLRRLLGLDRTPGTRRARILIVDTQDELVGLLVDEVRHVIRLREDDVEPPPAVFGRSETEHMLGVGRVDGEMYILLDVHSVIKLEKFIQTTPGGHKR